MDRYDAILEHLKKAQSAGVDTIAARLDAIAESLDELVQAAKSTVDDARPTEAEEVLAVTEIEGMVAELRSEEQTRLEEIAQLKEQIEATPTGISLHNLRTLDAARSQSELLRALLPMLSEHVGRAVVLVIREGVISAWSGIGFEDGEKLRDWHGGVAASPAFQQLAETSHPIRIVPENDPLLSEWLEGDDLPEESALLPISLRGKLMGIVYIDHSGNQPWDLETAQSLNAIACWLIDTLHHRSTVPTPTLAGLDGEEAREYPAADAFVETEAEADQGPPEEWREEPEKAEISGGEAPAPEASETTDIEEPEAPDSRADEPESIEYESVSEEDFSQPQDAEKATDVDYDFEPKPAAQPETGDAEFDPSATVRIDREDVGIPPQPEEGPVPMEAPPPEHPVEEEESSSFVEMEAPPPVRPVEPPPEPEPDAVEARDEDARQEEARRFARLLVSEIKLYNEDEVERGRVEKDISTRLKEDIERSREMYERRIPADVRESHDYFFDELVRILADGDADALGM